MCVNSHYKGFILTKNKKPTKSFTNSENLLSFDEANKFPEFGGVLNNDVILIDVDDETQAYKLFEIIKHLKLKTRVIKTNRGLHFIFKNSNITTNKTHTKTAIGVIVDIKGCGKNSYQILKFDNKLREVLLDFDDLDTLPNFLTPIKTKVDLMNLGEGGRNSTLYSYILTLQNAGLQIDDIKDTLKLINKFIFSQPLPHDELEIIMRDSAFSSEVFFGENGTFFFDKFAKFIVQKYFIKKINSVLHVYKDGIYQSGNSNLEFVMISEIPNLNKSKRGEVLAYLEIIVQEVSINNDAHLIAFKNGVLNVITNEFLDFNPEFIITNKIPHNYNPNSRSELLEKTISKLACNDDDVIQLLYESVGMTLFRKNELRKSFFLLGEKRNGKSTFLDMVINLLGSENVSNLDLSEIGDKFKTAEIAGKLANIGDDINDQFISNTSTFKKVISGDRVTVERKGQDPFVLSSYAKFFFSANNLPRLGRGKDNSAIIDRLIIIPFNGKFSKEDDDYDPFIKYKLRDNVVIESLIIKSIDGLRNVLANQQFTIPKSVKMQTEEYEKLNNPILMFFDDFEVCDIENEPVSDVYNAYVSFALTNGLQALSCLEFTKQVKQYFNLSVKRTQINKQKIRIFYKE